MCAVSIENSRRIHVLSQVTDWTLCKGICMDLTVEQSLCEVDGGRAFCLGSFHPNLELPMPQHAGQHEMSTDPKAMNTGETTRSKRGQEKQDSAPQAGHPRPQFSHNLPCKALKGDETPNGKSHLGQMVLGQPDFEKGGQSRSISARRGVGCLEMRFPLLRSSV